MSNGRDREQGSKRWWRTWDLTPCSGVERRQEIGHRQGLQPGCGEEGLEPEAREGTRVSGSGLPEECGGGRRAGERGEVWGSISPPKRAGFRLQVWETRRKGSVTWGDMGIPGKEPWGVSGLRDVERGCWHKPQGQSGGPAWWEAPSSATPAQLAQGRCFVQMFVEV